MGRLRFFGQEEVDIQLRTERGGSPRRLVPSRACAGVGRAFGGELVPERLDKLLEAIASAFVSSRFKSLAANRSIFLNSLRNPSVIADRIASDLPIQISQKQELLEVLNPAKRLEKLLGHLSGPLST